MPTTLQQGPGVTESHLSLGSGLRTRSYDVMLLTAVTSIVSNVVLSSPVTTYTVVTQAGNRLVYPSTLTLLLTQAAALTGSLQVRIRGFNQFGDFIEEETPLIAIEAKSNNFIYCAHVFSIVSEVAYKFTGAGTTPALNVGQRFDWVRTVDASNAHTAGYNLGIGLPMWLRYRQQGPQVAGPSTIGVRLFDFNLRPKAEVAAATMTLGVLPLDGQTHSIDGVVYTWRNVLALPFDILIGGTINASLVNFNNAINAVAETPGTTYGAGTTAHLTVRAELPTGATLTIRARNPGSAGNIIALDAVWASTTLLLGRSSLAELMGVVVKDFTVGGGSANVLDPLDTEIGYNTVGWSGSLEKLTILKVPINWTYVTGDPLFVSMRILSEDWGI